LLFILLCSAPFIFSLSRDGIDQYCSEHMDLSA